VAAGGVSEAGRYQLPQRRQWWWQGRVPVVDIVLVDMRERELTIKGQEILTSDKVTVRVSILVQYKVLDPTAAVTVVESYEDRIYTDVQLAARRSLASMTLEEILTNRTRLSEEIGAAVQDAAGGCGVSILRADVKDLVFPGNLQEVMNRVLAAQRLAEAQLVEARTQADRSRIEAEAQSVARRLAAEAAAEEQRLEAAARAEATIAQAAADAEAMGHLTTIGSALNDNPGLLRLKELDALARLAMADGARLYVGFDKSALPDERG
jgi:regulator of protease activity HflC (stomatin/prohibitin superfamily)